MRRTKLTARREELNLTRREVAKKAGISYSHYCDIEAGKKNPSIIVAGRIAEVLKTSPTIFFENAVA